MKDDKIEQDLAELVTDLFRTAKLIVEHVEGNNWVLDWFENSTLFRIILSISKDEDYLWTHLSKK